VGEFGTIEFTFNGIAAPTIDKALLTSIDYGDVVPVAFQGLTNVSVMGTNGCFSEVSVDFGNTVSPRTCANAAEGVEAFRITQRTVTATVDPEAVLVATNDHFGKLRAGTTGTFSFTLGSTAGNIIEFSAPNAQISSIGDEERDGIAVDALELRLNQPMSSETGEFSEFTLTFK
jgi:hypothetical protein